MDLFSDLDKVVETNTDPETEMAKKLSEFLRLFYKKDEDCKDDDCEDVTCPTCKGPLETVFGSLPLQVKCKSCSAVYLLREILTV